MLSQEGRLLQGQDGTARRIAVRQTVERVIDVRIAIGYGASSPDIAVGILAMVATRIQEPTGLLAGGLHIRASGELAGYDPVAVTGVGRPSAPWSPKSMQQERVRVCVLDLGTSVIKAAMVDAVGSLQALQTRPAPPVDPDSGRFDGRRYARETIELLGQLVHAAPGEVAALSISSQRATVLALDPAHEPLAPACSWMGARCTPSAMSFYGAHGLDRYRSITGLLPSPLYAIAKLAAGELPPPSQVTTYTDLQAYLLCELGATRPVIDPSNASAMGLLELERPRWSEALCGALDIPLHALPTVTPAGTAVGKLSPRAARATGLEAGTPLILGGGDQQCAVLGSGCFEPGDLALSLGTAAALAGPVVRAPSPPPLGLLAGHHVVPDQWFVEGFVPTFGAAAAWAAEALGLQRVESLAQKAAEARDSGGVYFVPSLAGSGSPDFDGTIRASWLGISVATTQAQLALAALEGLACELARVAHCFAEVAPLGQLRVVGGGSRADLQVQLIANILAVDLALCDCSEAALLGAAALAWVGAGRHKRVIAAAIAVGAHQAACLEAAEDPERDARQRRYGAALAAVRAFARGSA